jgi:hypothetical protein
MNMKKKLVLAALATLAVVAISGATMGYAASQGKVDICHIPPGNPENAHTINVSVNAIQAHLDHGDFIGSCDGGGV